MKYLKNVVTLEFRKDKCIGCGRCVEVCPHEVFSLTTTKPIKAEMIDRDACMECGACMRNCAYEAISVRPGVGCACAIVMGKLRGTEPDCGCGEGENEAAGCC